ncbi:extracellular solute-binding protein [bacterium AH-315-F03]|nr:extracellular solute-binding protein [bacterium AH-315-F03]
MILTRKTPRVINAFPLFCLLLAMAFGMSACDKKTPDTGNAVSTQVPSGTLATVEPIDETVSEPVTISWWHFWTDPTTKPIIEEIVAEFMTANPNVTVNLTGLTWADGHDKIVIALSSGSGPALIEMGSDWIPEFVDANRLADITGNMAESYPEFTGWEPVNNNGHLYGRPWILGTRIMFYNTDLLARAGYDSNFIPIGLQEFRQAVYKIDSLDEEIFGWGSNAAETHRLYKKFLPFFWSQRASLFSEDNQYCVLSSMEGGAALQLYKDLHDNCSLVDKQRRLEDAFLAGKVGAVLSGDWLLKRIRNEKPDFSFTTGMFPGRSTTGTSFLGGEYLVINQDSNAKEKAAALRLLRFVTSAENQVKFCEANFTATPSSKKATEDAFFTSDPHLQTFIKQLRYAKFPPFEPTWVYIEEEIEKAVERTLFEDMLPFQSLNQARGNIQKISRGN